jgi:hypothetical protein
MGHLSSEKRQTSVSEYSFETRHGFFVIYVKPQMVSPRKHTTDRVLTAGVENGSEKKPDSAPDGASTEKPEAQSRSYRSGRNVALMKLAFLRPENNEA